MNELSLRNVINITLVPEASGLSEFNTANLLLYSTETPIQSFGTDVFRIYKDATEVANDFGSSSLTYKMAVAVFQQTPNILSNSGSLIIALKSGSETQVAGFNRLKALVLFCGFMTTDSVANDIAAITEESGETSLADAVNAENNKINFVVSNVYTDVAGTFTAIKNATQKKTRCLYYGSTTEVDAKVMMASYASFAMSTIFEGSNTTTTMHLKSLVGITADPSITQTQLTACGTAGVDTYVSIQGNPCIFTSGANGYFDEVFNELWFVNALQVAGFNYLRKTSTKIPQTEKGIAGLKDAYAQVCLRGVNNAFIAAGSWTRPDTFGNPETFRNNIATNGYYIYSLPVSQQSQTDREARKAPLVQIAVKTAGAVHSTSVIIYVNI